MVQIIQSQPTLRQSALTDSLGQFANNLVNSYQQGQQTKRQEALRALDKTMDLRSQGYDVNVDQVSQLYTNPQEGFGGIFDKRTDEYVKKVERENLKLQQEQEDRAFDREIKRGQLDATTSNQRYQRERDQKEFTLKERELGIKERDNDPRFKMQKEVAADQSKELAKKNANLYSVRGAMDKALGQLSNKNLSEDEKVKVGQGLLKLLNSAEGADAVGAEEAKRIGDYLEYAYGNLTGVGPARIGRDLAGFTKQVENYRDLLGERIKGNEDGLNALSQGRSLGSLIPENPRQAIGSQDSAQIINQVKTMSREDKIKLLQGGV